MQHHGHFQDQIHLAVRALCVVVESGGGSPALVGALRALSSMAREVVDQGLMDEVLETLDKLQPDRHFERRVAEGVRSRLKEAQEVRRSPHAARRAPPQPIHPPFPPSPSLMRRYRSVNSAI